MSRQSLLGTCVKCQKNKSEVGVVERYYVIGKRLYAGEPQFIGLMPARGYCAECFFARAKARKMSRASFNQLERRLKEKGWTGYKGEKAPQTFYCCGCAFPELDGRSTGSAWVRLDNYAENVNWVAGLTASQAEYVAIIAVLENLKAGSRTLIYTDSKPVVKNFYDGLAISDTKLVPQVEKICQLIEQKKLDVKVQWVSRFDNRARSFLLRARFE